MKIFKAIFLLLMIGIVVGFGYYVNEQTKNWPSLGVVLGKENITINNNIKATIVAKPAIDLNSNQIPSLEFVSQTEYTQGDGNASTIVKLIDWKGDKINTSCWELVLYPDKTTLFDWTPMIQQWTYGNYYLTFPVPTALGEYDQEVRCYVSSKNISIGKGFHVSNISTNVNAKIDSLKQDVMTVIE
jgi:hypothetical protein